MDQEKLPERIETFFMTCIVCGNEVVYKWASGERSGVIAHSESYILIADWIIHAACWDKVCKETPY